MSGFKDSKNVIVSIETEPGGVKEFLDTEY